MRAKDLALPLYVSRKVVNGSDIVEWAKNQGLTSMLEPDDLHVTICYSKEPMNWDRVERQDDEIEIDGSIAESEDQPLRQMEMFGKEHDILVLQIESDALQQRWQEFCDAGASYDFPEYKPHITISYHAADIDQSTIEPYRGDIVLGPEIFKKIEKEWSGDAKEINLTESILKESIAHRGIDYVIVRSPTAAQLSSMMTNARHTEGLRGLLDKKVLYVWDAYYANHSDACRSLGIEFGSNADLLCLHLRPDEFVIQTDHIGIQFSEDDEDQVSYTDSDENWFKAVYRAIRAGMKTLQSMRSLNSFYDGHINIEFDDPYQWNELKRMVGGSVMESKTISADGFRVHVDPTAGQLAALCDRVEQMRGITDGEHSYLWVAYEGTHMDAMHRLGIDSRHYASRFYAFLPDINDDLPLGDDGNVEETLRNGVIISARPHSFPLIKKVSSVARWFAPRVGQPPVMEAVEDHDGIRFFRNPSRFQVLALMQHFGELRGCDDGRSLWVWDAHENAHHYSAQKMLGITASTVVDFYIQNEEPEQYGYDPIRIGSYWLRCDPIDQPRLMRSGAFRRLVGGKEYTGELQEAHTGALPRKFWLVFDVPTGNISNDEYGNRMLSRLKQIGEGKLEGIRGISDSREIVTDWFLMCRNAVLVMDPQSVMDMNDIHKIQYDDPDHLCQNGMEALYRIWNKEGVSGIKDHRGLFDNMFDYFLTELGADDLTPNNSIARQLRNNNAMYKLGQRFRENPPRIDTSGELADLFYNWLCEPADPMSWRDREMATELSQMRKEITTAVMRMLGRVARIYGSESEWMVNSSSFTVPPNSILMLGVDPEVISGYQTWKNDQTINHETGLYSRYHRYERLMAAIDEYRLRDRYAIRIVDASKFENNRSTITSRRKKLS